jgi:CDP-diglyceride synthetase
MSQPFQLVARLTEMVSRCIIATTLASCIFTAVYWHHEIWVYRGAWLALAFDLAWTLCRKFYFTRLCPSLVLLMIWHFVGTSIQQLYQGYQINPSLVLILIAVTQSSDILQYLGGRYLGRHPVGWISPKKTYEGYLISLTILGISSYVATWFQAATDRFVLIGILGILGGMINSVIKRYLGIKDWSPLLGSHGGFLDRIDSLILPGLYLV